MSRDTYIVDTRVSYFCDNGYRFSSETTMRVCLTSGTWTMEDIECIKSKNVCKTVQETNVCWRNSFQLHTNYVHLLLIVVTR